ncbi:unnamed protein product [Phytophthora fragariaefolia]|uniref:Unnamed protein product n=1 Tax=Phytophthora fragariaefolia TaxID=1490495 RepID=A0A9W6XXB0_9STRA|nr:unnamed protein product [Phytophthora fragariaefolia]
MGTPLQLRLVTLVLAKLSGGALAVDSLAPVVSDFLVADLSLSRAIEFSAAGSLALLDLVWARSRRATESSAWGAAKLLATKDYYYRWEFSLALVQAVRRADVNMVQWLLRHFSGCPVDSDVVEEAATAGHLWVLQLLEADTSHGGITWSNRGLALAARNGHWDVVRWLQQRLGTPKTEPRSSWRRTVVADHAFEQNNLLQLQWALAQGYEVSNCRVGDQCGAVGGGDSWETVRFVLERDPSFDIIVTIIDHAGVKAAQVGDLEFMMWMMSRFGTGQYESGLGHLLDAAGEAGHISVLEYLIKHFCNAGIRHDPSAAMYAAAKNGKLEVVKWLVDRYSNDLSVILFQHQRGKRRARRNVRPIIDIAASRGHLEVVKVLDQLERSQPKKRKRDECNSLPSDEPIPICTTNAMDFAASHGHLEVVKWLHAHRSEGCTTLAMDEAAANGHLDVVQWLHENRSEGCTTDAVDGAASRYCHMSSCCRTSRYTSSCGNVLKDRKAYEPNTFVKNQLSIIKWLHANHWIGCTVKAMDGAAANGNFEMVQWFHENTTAECTHRVMDEAARYGRLDIVRWLHTSRSEGCSLGGMDNAAWGGHLDILKWLHVNKPEGFSFYTLSEVGKVN